MSLISTKNQCIHSTYISDRDERNGLFEEWMYKLYETLNDRPRFVYASDMNDTYSDVQYDYNDRF